MAEESDEYLKRLENSNIIFLRFYKLKDSNIKIKLLLEFYKYHINVPRVFMQNLFLIAY